MMKKLLLIFLFFLPLLPASAQDTEPHLLFKEVPIDGTIREFVGKLMEKGLVFVQETEETAVLTGPFAGSNNCGIGVYKYDGIDLASSVGVSFPLYDNWESIYTNYSDLKDRLTQKYGTPGKCTEKFTGLTTPEGDSMKFVNLLRGDCHYETTFVTERGSITLRIEKVTGEHKGFVFLSYIDRINAMKVSSSVNDDL